MLPREWVMSLDEWLYRVPGHTGGVSTIAKCETDTEIQRCGEMLALRSQWEPKENVCIPSSSWAACLDPWFLLYILCTYGHGTARETSAPARGRLPIASLRPGRTEATSQQDADSGITVIRGLERWHVAFQKTRRFKLQIHWRVDWNGPGKASCFW